jgi:DNA-binding beta-propeller fold protein YncE
MHRKFPALAACLFVSFISAHAQSGPYKVLADTKVGGTGGYDYIYADAENRKLYIPRLGGDSPRVTVFNLDTLAHISDIPATQAHGVAVDPKSGHAFSSSNPAVMWDAKTLAQIKTIPLQGRPDGIEDDPIESRVYVFSHSAPNVTVLDAKDGAILGTIDAGGAVEQAVLDGKGHLYVDLEDKGSVAVIDTKAMKLTGTISLAPKGDGCAGLALDAKHGILFAACSEPNVMVVVNAADSKILTTLPIGKGCDGATFNPHTDEAFATAGDGTLTVVKESSPTSFAVEQTVATPTRARTITLDEKTGHILTQTAEFGPAPAPAPGQRYARPPMIPDTFQILVVGK